MIEVQITGLNAVASRLAAAGVKIQDVAATALYEFAQEIRTESMKRTPVDTGALRASHVVSAPTRSGNTVEVRIGVGGPATPYAIYVHENLSASHTVGRSKFLESAVLDAVPTMARRIAARIHLESTVLP
jgi:hypothetical protein